MSHGAGEEIETFVSVSLRLLADLDVSIGVSCA
jgi:hypothetical protein